MCRIRFLPPTPLQLLLRFRRSVPLLCPTLSMPRRIECSIRVRRPKRCISWFPVPLSTMWRQSSTFGLLGQELRCWEEKLYEAWELRKKWPSDCSGVFSVFEKWADGDTEEIPITMKLDQSTYVCEAALWLIWRTRGEMRLGSQAHPHVWFSKCMASLPKIPPRSCWFSGGSMHSRSLLRGLWYERKGIDFLTFWYIFRDYGLNNHGNP